MPLLARDKASEMKKIWRRLNFKHLIVVDCMDRFRAGGLAIWWSREIVMNLLSLSHNHIDVEVVSGPFSHPWCLMGIYGFPEDHNKHQTWEVLHALKNQSQLPCCIFSDNNDIMFDKKKKGGNQKSTECMQRIRDIVDMCMLQDIGFCGYPYTWNNGQTEEHNIQECLDRMFATEDLLNIILVAALLLTIMHLLYS